MENINGKLNKMWSADCLGTGKKLGSAKKIENKPSISISDRANYKLDVLKAKTTKNILEIKTDINLRTGVTDSEKIYIRNRVKGAKIYQSANYWKSHIMSAIDETISSHFLSPQDDVMSIELAAFNEKLPGMFYCTSMFLYKVNFNKEKSRKMMEEMMSLYKIKPNSAAWNNVVNGFLKNGRLPE